MNCLYVYFTAAAARTKQIIIQIKQLKLAFLKQTVKCFCFCDPFHISSVRLSDASLVESLCLFDQRLFQTSGLELCFVRCIYLAV